MPLTTLEMELKRDDCTAERTLGTLWIDNVYQCQTLEPALAILNPLEDHPAIPEGKFRVSIGYSVKFQRMVPMLSKVPGRAAIEIHAGNMAENTEGCILVGRHRFGSTVLHSRDALNDLMPKLAAVLVTQGDVWITVVRTKGIQI